VARPVTVRRLLSTTAGTAASATTRLPPAAQDVTQPSDAHGGFGDLLDLRSRLATPIGICDADEPFDVARQRRGIKAVLGDMRQVGPGALAQEAQSGPAPRLEATGTNGPDHALSRAFPLGDGGPTALGRGSSAL
jgi:hypothetical protein